TVRRQVEMYGGEVYASSDGLGLGSELMVRVPLDAEESGSGAPGAERHKSDAPRPSRQVVVIDDNVDAADTLALLLRIEGHEVRVAHSGPEALAILDEFQPQLILLDIGMPGM